MKGNLHSLICLFNNINYGKCYITNNTWLVLEPLYDYFEARFFLRDAKTHADIKTFKTADQLEQFIKSEIQKEEMQNVEN